MKLVSLAVTSALIAAPAFAHGGAHLHPHGMELTAAGLAALSVALIVFAWRR